MSPHGPSENYGGVSALGCATGIPRGLLRGGGMTSETRDAALRPWSTLISRYVGIIKPIFVSAFAMTPTTEQATAGGDA